MKAEILPIVDENGNPVGMATREQCHSNPRLLHPVVHLHVFDSDGRLYLQQRSLSKDLYPGYWDTAVGGHIRVGETVGEALLREGREELGIDVSASTFLFTYIWTNKNETEYVYSYKLIYSGNINPPPTEVMGGRFFPFAEIKQNLSKNIFTPNFTHEFCLFIEKGIIEDR
jgi:isopentenyldiphosphate isomerase